MSHDHDAPPPDMLPEEHVHTAHLVTEMPDDVRVLVADIESRALAFATITDEATFKAADALLVEAGKIEKATKAKLAELKAPILELSRKLEASAGEVLAPLLTIKQDLGKRSQQWLAAENARREAERRKAQEEARLKQEELRREAERKAKEEADRRAAERAAAAPGEAPPPDAPAEKPPEVIVPTVYVEPTQDALKSSSTKMVPHKIVHYDNPELIPMKYGDTPLWKLDTVTIDRLAKAGAPIPGVRVETEMRVARKG